MKKMVQCWLRLAIWGLWMALCVRARVADGLRRSPARHTLFCG